ncbi:MAG: NHL repeat-containing protein [Gammaproteobacteria bacterium]
MHTEPAIGTMKWSNLLLFVVALAASGMTTTATASPAVTKTSCTLCLYGPDNMTFDTVGNIYLVDTDHNTRSRVMKLSPQGKKLGEWHVFPVVPGHDNGPSGIALDKDGAILVTDAQGILKLSPTGKLLATIGADPGIYDVQSHVAVDQKGDIYFAQAQRNLIRKFTPAGKLRARWQRDKGSGPDQWNHPEQVSLAPDGNLVVQDWGNHRMMILSPSGRTILTFDATRNVPLKLASISSACVDREGNIYVADYQLFRVQEFDSHGKLLATIGNTPGNILFEQAPNSLACSGGGDLYATDGLSVVKFSREGKLLARWQ